MSPELLQIRILMVRLGDMPSIDTAPAPHVSNGDALKRLRYLLKRGPDDPHRSNEDQD